ncbi:MAG: hypothetical protein ACREDO_09175 [Methyloceanibacter sp.]
MRDIRGDLQLRADRIREQIKLAQTEFEKNVGQLKIEQERRLDHLKAEREAVTRLMKIVRWHQDVRAVLTAAKTAAEAAEAACRSTVEKTKTNA